MNRKNIAIFVAALLIPGGFVALAGAFIVRLMSRTERGRQVLANAERSIGTAKAKAPAWLFTPLRVPALQRAA